MTLSDLIERLTALQDEHGADAEVRLAHQPSWPFEYAIDQVIACDMHGDEKQEINDFLNEADPLEDGDAIDEARARLGELDGEPQVVVYLGEGSQLGYLPGVASAELGWSR